MRTKPEDHVRETSATGSKLSDEEMDSLADCKTSKCSKVSNITDI